LDHDVDGTCASHDSRRWFLLFGPGAQKVSSLSHLAYNDGHRRRQFPSMSFPANPTASSPTKHSLTRDSGSFGDTHSLSAKTQTPSLETLSTLVSATFLVPRLVPFPIFFSPRTRECSAPSCKLPHESYRSFRRSTLSFESCGVLLLGTPATLGDP